MSYEEYFKLNEQPFSNTPDSRFYFESQQHNQAMLRLMHAIRTMKGLALLVGDVGTGKTTLARKLLNNLDEKEFESALLVVVHSSVTPEWLLRKIALQMGVRKPAAGKVELLSQLYERLLEIHQSGRKAVVLVDEAQMLQTRELMEEFRGLLNLEMPGEKMITFVFFALSSIDQHLSLDEPLKQRVAVKYKLGSMKPSSTEAYMLHRLKVAGCDREIFEGEAPALIHQYSRGIPRLINVICDNAMFEAFLMKQESVGEDIIASVAEDLGLKKEYSTNERRIIPERRVTPERRITVSGEGRSPKEADLDDREADLDDEEEGALDYLEETEE
jgi:type II secretory pathway predicted ATPase ExeA